MISVRQNPNFKRFFQVISFGRIIEEIDSKARVLRLAKEEAKRHNVTHVNFLGEFIKTEE